MKVRKLLLIGMLAAVLGITGCESNSKEEAPQEEVEEVVQEEPEQEEAEEEIEEEPTEETTEENEPEMTEEEAAFLIGTWGNETAFSEDETMKFSMAYYTEFRTDGTVEQNGYRNKDCGTYRYLDKNTVEAVYDSNTFHDAADPDNHDPIEGYQYTVTYYLDREAGTIRAEYSEEFFDALTSNATNGVLQKIPDR